MYLNDGNNCQCKEDFVNAGDTCVLEAERKALADNEWIIEDFQNRVTYYDIWSLETGASGADDVKTVVSDVFDYLYIQSAVGCMNDGNPQKCQSLANLCVLQLYDELTIACKLFQYLQMNQFTTESSQVDFYNDSGWRKDLPWLYYDRSPQEVIKEQDPINLVVSFSMFGNDPSRTNQLTFYLARYTVEGEFQGFQEFKT